MLGPSRNTKASVAGAASVRGIGGGKELREARGLIATVMSLNFILMATSATGQFLSRPMTIMMYHVQRLLRQLCEEWMEGGQAAVRKFHWPGPLCQLWGWREVKDRQIPDTNT